MLKIKYKSWQNCPQRCIRYAKILIYDIFLLMMRNGARHQSPQSVRWSINQHRLYWQFIRKLFFVHQRQREAFRCPCGVAHQPLKIQCIASTRLNCFNHHNSAIIIIIDKTPHKLMHRRVFRSSYRCATPRTRPSTSPRIHKFFFEFYAALMDHFEFDNYTECHSSEANRWSAMCVDWMTASIRRLCIALYKVVRRRYEKLVKRFYSSAEM